MRIGVLSNLKAGRSQLSRILGALDGYPDVLREETEHKEALPDALAALAKEGVELLVVNGGDGTLQHVLTELLGNDEYDRLPWVAPLRGGRTNMTALDFGAQRDPEKALRALIESARAGTLAARRVDRPVLRVTTRTGDVRYGMFFGAGMIHRAISLTHRLFPGGRSQGVLGAGLVTASLITQATTLRPKEGVLTPDKVQILLDGEMVRQGEFYLVIASTLGRLFLRMNPFWGREDAGVRFTAIATSGHRPWAAAPSILRGRPKRWVTAENGYNSRNVDRAQLAFDCGFTIDGEIFEPVAGEGVTLEADRRITFIRA